MKKLLVKSILLASVLVPLLGAGGLLGHDELSAQTADPLGQTTPSISDDLIGKFVRLTAPGVVIDGGVIESIAGDTLLVASEGIRWSVQGSLLESLSIRESRTARAAVIGAVPGVVLGVLGKYLINKMDCSSNGLDCPPANLATGALVGAGLGSLIGAIAGSMSEHWRDVVP